METEEVFFLLLRIKDSMRNNLMKERITYQVWFIHKNGIINPKSSMGKYAISITTILEELKRIEQTESPSAAALACRLRQDIACILIK